MKSFVPVVFGFLTWHALAQDVSFTFEEWKDPGIFETNQSAMHTPLVPYVDKARALKQNAEACPYYQSLNGRWKFAWSVVPGR